MTQYLEATWEDGLCGCPIEVWSVNGHPVRMHFELAGRCPAPCAVAEIYTLGKPRRSGVRGTLGVQDVQAAMRTMLLAWAEGETNGK